MPGSRRIETYETIQIRKNYNALGSPLATQYFAADGDHWIRKQNWLYYNVSECLWESISCNEQGLLIFQKISNNNLHGNPPKENQFHTLHLLDYTNNYLAGRLQFPSESTNLQQLIYSNNDFVGPLIVEGGAIATTNNLKVLKLDNNRFSDSIHKGFSLFPELKVLNLTRNQFQRTVPIEVQFIPKLISLGLGSNAYKGTIPTESGLLMELRDLDLSENTSTDIVGTIPTELGALSFLRQLDLSGTAIEGDLPTQLCQRQAMGELEIRANCSLVNCCQ
jgi:Leucine-rich repeat (LRR) protein